MDNIKKIRVSGVDYSVYDEQAHDEISSIDASIPAGLTENSEEKKIYLVNKNGENIGEGVIISTIEPTPDLSTETIYLQCTDPTAISLLDTNYPSTEYLYERLFDYFTGNNQKPIVLIVDYITNESKGFHHRLVFRPDFLVQRLAERQVILSCVGYVYESSTQEYTNPSSRWTIVVSETPYATSLTMTEYTESTT